MNRINIRCIAFGCFGTLVFVGQTTYAEIAWLSGISNISTSYNYDIEGGGGWLESDSNVGSMVESPISISAITSQTSVNFDVNDGGFNWFSNLVADSIGEIDMDGTFLATSDMSIFLDFEGDFNSLQFTLYEQETSTTLASLGIWNAQDSVLNLVAGNHYSISLYADTYGGASSVTFQPVPAPAVIVLLSIAGLSQRRRRR